MQACANAESFGALFSSKEKTFPLDLLSLRASSLLFLK